MISAVSGVGLRVALVDQHRHRLRRCHASPFRKHHLIECPRRVRPNFVTPSPISMVARPAQARREKWMSSRTMIQARPGGISPKLRSFISVTRPVSK